MLSSPSENDVISMKKRKRQRNLVDLRVLVLFSSLHVCHPRLVIVNNRTRSVQC